jgi:hypothetical protein
MGVIKRGTLMRAQRVWWPVEPDFLSGLKLVPNIYLAEFRKQLLDQKNRCQDLAGLLHAELRHLGSFIREWLGLTLQI